MSGIVKALTCVLGVLAVVACLATVGIIGYSMTSTEDNNTMETAQNRETETPPPLPTEVPAVPTTAPDVSPTPEDNRTPAPVQNVREMLDHVHDYEESVEKKATCYSAGKIKYACSCGHTYYVDIMSTGHVPDDWEIVRKPDAEEEGLRVQKCIYCDEIVAQESIPLESSSDGTGGVDENHVHQYTAATDREPTCTLAGLRKYTCSCGDFYTEMIPAPGHVATDWTTAEEATTTKMGTEQRTCTVCGVVLDSRPVNMVSPSPAASSSNNNNSNNNNNNNSNASPAASGAATASPSATPSAVPSATPHAHSYQSYVLKTANCTEVGIRSFVCTCGSSYAETIERDLNNHTYRSMVVPATKTSQGYTVYTCVRCNYSYVDNYTPALAN